MARKMTATMLMLAVMLGAMGARADLPTDPCQRCAVKALRGAYGQLPRWKHDAYIWIVAKGIRCGGNLAKITSYGPWEGCGTETFSGDRACTEFVSVDPEHIPLGTLVWTPWGLRYAMDTGGAVKVQDRYLRDGENGNFDYYTLRGVETERCQPWVVVKQLTDWNWYGLRKWRDWTKQGRWSSKQH